MIKVLHVIGRRPRGGIGTFLKNMVINNQNEDIKFDFLIHAKEKTGEFDNFVEQYGSNVFVMSELSFKNHIENKNMLRDFYRSNNYNVIHIHSPNIAVLNYKLAKKNDQRVKFVIHSHSSKLSDTFLKSIRNYFLNFRIKYLDTYRVACGERAGEFLFKNKEYQIISNGIDVLEYQFNSEDRKNKRTELGLENEFIIGHVGNYFKVKNHEFIIDLAYQLKNNRNKFIFILIGDGQEFKKIQSKISELELEDTVLQLGRREDISELMSAMDIFILPSHFEGFPLVSLEAQASGLDCIFSDTISQEIDVTQKNSFLNLNINEWIEEILKKRNTTFSEDSNYDERINKNSDLKKFDSKYTNIELNKIYLELLKENR